MSSFPLAVCMGLGSLWLAGAWQGTAVLVCTRLLLCLQPTLAPRLRYRVCCAGYGLAAGLPLLAGVHFGSGRLPAFAHAAAPLVMLNQRWALLFGGMCLFASVAGGVRLAAGLWMMRRLRRSATPAPASLSEAYAGLLRHAGRGPLALYFSEEVTAPAALGYRHPAIVLPQTLAASLSREGMEQVLRHEAEHLRRRDDWAALLTGCVRCLLPLQPALSGLERQLRAAREMACDDAVLHTASARAYAENLLAIARTAGRRPGPRMVLQLHGPYRELRGRIDHILAAREQSAGLTRRSRIAAAAGLLLLPGLLMESPALVGFHADAVASSAPVTARLEPLPPAKSAAAVRGALVRPATLRRGRRARPLAPHLLAAAPLRSVEPVEDSPPAFPVLVLWNGQEGRVVLLPLRAAMPDISGIRRSFLLLPL